MAVNVFRCRICGEAYIGEHAPTRCPFCGSYEKLIIDNKDYKDTFDIKISKKELELVKKALDFEISNASFYQCAKDKADTEEAKGMFKILSKVEAEHASIWKKILKLEKIDIPKYDACSDKFKGNLQESHERETHAIEFYGKAARECEHPRLRQIFGALVQVETDHLYLSEVRLNKR
ncbi:MAG: ferritin family protein [Candidatus Woesearchaeota archaeon]